MADRRELSTQDLAKPARSDDRPAVEDPRAVHDTPARTTLFPEDEAGPFRSRWNDVQGRFVDAPREAVQQADSLVAEVMSRMAQVFASERTNLEQQWDRGDQVTTEVLRIALQRYRAFFDRLLTV